MASAPRELPAHLSDAVADEVRRVARRIGDLALVRGVARIDFLTDGDELLVNEINTIPGSLARYLWIDPVVPFATLLTDMIAEATARPTFFYNAAGSRRSGPARRIVHRSQAGLTGADRGARTGRAARRGQSSAGRAPTRTSRDSSP